MLLAICLTCFVKCLFNSLPIFYCTVGFFSYCFLLILYSFGIQVLSWIYLLHISSPILGLAFHSLIGVFWGTEAFNSNKAQLIYMFPFTISTLYLYNCPLKKYLLILGTEEYSLMFPSRNVIVLPFTFIFFNIVGGRFIFSSMGIQLTQRPLLKWSFFPHCTEVSLLSWIIWLCMCVSISGHPILYLLV